MIQAPGRVRGHWKPSVLYIEGDLVLYQNIWYIALPEPVENKIDYANEFRKSTNIGRIPDQPVGAYTYWKVSEWKNITQEITRGEDEFVRLQSTDQRLVDSYLLSKGIPDWYYYELLGNYNTRTEMRNVVDLLRTVRGTIEGLETYLNLIGLTADVIRLKPEEIYEVSYKDEIFELTSEQFFYSWEYPDNSDTRSWLKRLEDSLKEQYPDNEEDRWYRNGILYGVWLDPLDLQTEGLFFQQFDIKDNFQSSLIQRIKIGDEWQDKIWYTYKSITFDQTSDNSKYLIDIKTLINEEYTELGDGVVREKDQQRYSCHVSRLMNFLLPAWIRAESRLRILDIRRGWRDHAAWECTIADPLYEGLQPYTLTILPFTGWDPSDSNYLSNNYLGQTDAWGVEIELPNGDKVNIDSFPGNYWSQDYEIDGRVISIKREEEVLKVVMFPGEKIKLRAYEKIETNNYQFFRWQYLNWNYPVAHFKVSGATERMKWKDLEDFTWTELENKTWSEVAEKTVEALYFEDKIFNI
jgi:hypothetical protein